uniref:DNA/RNA-binding protein Alba-like domain-containing protein n=1 Tax=Aegilops tauschii subsp. strangulata TaxID=200361 RepID=A0A453HBF7_AEGTS
GGRRPGPEMDRYQRVERPRPESAIAENEIRITAQGLIRNYVSYATSLLQDRKIKEIVLKAMGQAISKSVAVTEIIKKRVPGLYQDTNISSVSITDVWEPIEEGLVPLSFCFFLPSCYHIKLCGTEDSNLFQWLLILQTGDDSPCFNDFNYFVSSRFGPKFPRVSKPGLC